jgi:CBS domain-containing protein
MASDVLTPSSDLTVGDIMTAPAITVHPSASTADVVECLLRNDIGAVPVVDSQGRLCGIVSQSDLALRAAYGVSNDKALAMVGEIIQGAPAPWVDRVHAQSAADLMTDAVVTATPQDSVVETTRRMLQHRCTRVPVVADDRVVGIITRRDVLRILAGEGARAGERSSSVTELSADEAMRFLKSSGVGRLAYVADGHPALVPVDYVVADGMVVFRTGPGEKLDLVPMRRVAFEADDVSSDLAWSVVVHGHAREVTTALGSEYARLRAVPITAHIPGERAHWIAIEITAITGRLIRRT